MATRTTKAIRKTRTSSKAKVAAGARGARTTGEAGRPARRSTSIVPVGLVQTSCVADPSVNRARQVRLIERAAESGARVICTQELFASQYFCQSEDHRFFELAESIPGPSTDAFSRIAKKHGVVIVASLFERRATGLYHNTAAIIDADGSLMGVYRKMHIPDDPLFYEKFYFTPGDAPAGHGTASAIDGEDEAGFRVWKTRHAKIGVLICWDQWFPEGARLTALQGAEILFYPTAIGWHPSEREEYGEAQHDSWETMMRSHAIANGCYVVAVNRFGHERVLGADGKPVSQDGLVFWGQSFVAQPDGQVAFRATPDKEQVAVVDCDLSRVEFSRTHWPFLRDRRVDAYGGLVRRFIDR